MSCALSLTKALKWTYWPKKLFIQRDINKFQSHNLFKVATATHSLISGFFFLFFVDLHLDLC